MAAQTLAFILLAFTALILRFLNRTDAPKIRNIPEIPGVPIFGNLIQLGGNHARVAGSWVKKYGPIFQVRLGNKVRDALPELGLVLTLSRE